jgi:hypothetical protein
VDVLAPRLNLTSQQLGRHQRLGLEGRFSDGGVLPASSTVMQMRRIAVSRPREEGREKRRANPPARRHAAQTRGQDVLKSIASGGSFPLRPPRQRTSIRAESALRQLLDSDDEPLVVLNLELMQALGMVKLDPAPTPPPSQVASAARPGHQG